MSKMVDRKAQELQDKNKMGPRHDDEFIRQAMNASPELKQATNVQATPFLTIGFIKVYYLTVTGVAPKFQKIIAFTWPKLDSNVLGTLLYDAKKDTLNGFLAVTNNCLIVREYKITGGAQNV